MTKCISTTESIAANEYKVETSHINILPCNNKQLKQDLYKIFSYQPTYINIQADDTQEMLLLKNVDSITVMSDLNKSVHFTL